VEGVSPSRPGKPIAFSRNIPAPGKGRRRQSFSDRNQRLMAPRWQAGPRPFSISPFETILTARGDKTGMRQILLFGQAGKGRPPKEAAAEPAPLTAAFGV